MLFYPSSLRKDGRFSEFSIFKFYKDSATGQNITFHFARNIPVATPEAERDLEKKPAEVAAGSAAGDGQVPALPAVMLSSAQQKSIRRQ